MVGDEGVDPPVIITAPPNALGFDTLASSNNGQQQGTVYSDEVVVRARAITGITDRTVAEGAFSNVV